MLSKSLNVFHEEPPLRLLCEHVPRVLELSALVFCSRLRVGRLFRSRKSSSASEEWKIKPGFAWEGRLAAGLPGPLGFATCYGVVGRRGCPCVARGFGS